MAPGWTDGLGNLVQKALKGTSWTPRLPSSAEETYDLLLASLSYAVGEEKMRVEVELPRGFRLGFQGIKDQLVPVPEKDLSPERIAWGDRELAAAVLLGYGEPANLCTVFRTSQLATAAKREWKTWGKSHILSLSPKGPKKQKPSRARAFGGEEAGNATPRDRLVSAVRRNGIKTLVVVAPKAEQLKILNEANDQIGQQTQIILVNPRVRGPSARGTELHSAAAAGYDPVFHMRHAGRGGQGLVFRSVQPDDKAYWFLAQRTFPSMEPVQVSMGSSEPTVEEVAKAFP